MVMHRLPAAGRLQAAVVPRPAPTWGVVLLDEGSGNGRPDDLAGGDRHSVELIEACNQSRKP